MGRGMLTRPPQRAVGAEKPRRQRGIADPKFAQPPRALHPIVAELRAARVRAGVSQSALAEKMGYALSVFSKWERGTYAPNLRRLMDWAEALGLEIRIIEREEKDR